MRLQANYISIKNQSKHQLLFTIQRRRIITDNLRRDINIRVRYPTLSESKTNNDNGNTELIRNSRLWKYHTDYMSKYLSVTSEMSERLYRNGPS